MANDWFTPEATMAMVGEHVCTPDHNPLLCQLLYGSAFWHKDDFPALTKAVLAHAAKADKERPSGGESEP